MSDSHLEITFYCCLFLYFVFLLLNVIMVERLWSSIEYENPEFWENGPADKNNASTDKTLGIYGNLFLHGNSIFKNNRKLRITNIIFCISTIVIHIFFLCFLCFLLVLILGG
ncbi:MAG: hypothetical protein COA90_05440 [Gammaproteobacteria bacterium]|nr:MAG: hypothetical protein COA90_05440 [Gammaproteobacteria bacterium]